MRFTSLMLVGRRPGSPSDGRLMRVERHLKTGRVLREQNQLRFEGFHPAAKSAGRMGHTAKWKIILVA
jgi:hypothetical protein